MIPSPTIDDLASRIRERLSPDSPNQWLGPYILFLGEGCATAAGAPSREAIARQALAMFAPDQDKPSPDEPAHSIFERFAKHTASLSPASMGRMLRSLHAQVAVPSFYQHLAQLIREGYFPLILTMNFDTLLEQALTNAGVRSTDYRITTFGASRISSSNEPYSEKPNCLTHIVKLHGDLAQDIAQVTPDQIEEALNASRRWIKSDLKGDIIVVDHVLSDDPIDRWLGHSPGRELWWVAQHPPTDPAKVQSWTEERVNEITGELGRPQVFFQQLGFRLSGMPDVATLETIGIPHIADSLRNEIVRNQSELFSLDQESASGERPQQVQRQIDYHKQEITKLEDKFRALPDVQPQVLEYVRRIADRLDNHGPRVLDSSTLASLSGFVNSNVKALELELGKETPNQILVSAVLGGTLTFADKLLTEYGPTLVDPADLKHLAALAPTAAFKVVL
jgi:hypothetical protein